MKNYGDICQIKGYEVPLVDVITGGSPCQDLSVAGKRAGLKHSEMGDDETTRSGLFMEQIRIIKEQRNESKKQLSMRQSVVDFRHIQPRYTVWENVCGAFSSNNGEDFRAVLEETCKVADENAYVPQLAKGQKWANAGCIMGDGYSVAWRVHDAQFWGVPQRRKRICVLADYGGHTAPEILFELLGETNDPESYKIVTDIREQSRPEIQVVGKSLSGNTEQGNEKGEGVTETVTDSVGEASSYTLKIRGGVDIDSHGKRAGKGALVQTELSGTLGVSQDQTLITGEPTCLQRRFSNVNVYENGVTPTLEAGAGEGGNNMPMVMGCDLYNQTATGDVAMSITGAATDPHHIPCVCLEPDDSIKDNNDPQSVVCIEGNGVRESHKGDGYKESDTMYTLNTVEQHAVAYGISSYDSNAMKSPNPHSGVYEADTSRTLDLNGGSPACNQGGMAVVQAFDGLNNATSEEVSPTLMCQRQDVKNIPSVAYGLDRASFNQGKNAKFSFSVDEELAPSLVAKGPGGGISETVGSLCARDYKGVGNQYVDEGKCIIQQAND